LRRDNFGAPSHSLQTGQFYPWQTLHLWWMSQCTRNFEIYGLLIGNRTAKELEGDARGGGAGLFLLVDAVDAEPGDAQANPARTGMAPRSSPDTRQMATIRP
jgi:hypothetical protein